MADKSVLLKLVERGSETSSKIFNLQVPVGEKVYTPTTAQAICGPANVPYKIPFDVDNPSTAETTDELIGITSLYSQNIPLSYSINDLNENFIEMSASPDGQIGTSETNAQFECWGLSGILSIRLCSFPNPEAPTETVFQSRVSTIQSTAYVNKYIWESYRYGPHWDPSNPWNNAWITPNRDWFNPNAYTNIGLIVQNGVRPRISFHFEKFRDPRWEVGRFIDCLVINHWFWDRNPDTSEGAPPYIYRIRNQQIIAAKYISDNPLTPQTPLTPSKTKNSTPDGGRGTRNNASAKVPMPSATDLDGFSRYSGGDEPGIHLYSISPQNWGKLESQLWSTDLVNKIAQSIRTGTILKNPDQYVISAVRIGLPIGISSAPGIYSVSVGNVNFERGAPYKQVLGTILTSRFAETETYDFQVPFYSRTFLDFDPMTKIQLHIPYCGIMSISPDACMGGWVEVKYIVDLISAECTAIVRTTDQFGNTKITGCMSGVCGVSIPFLTNTLNQEKIASSIGALVTGVATDNIGGIAKGALGLLETKNDLMNSTKVSDSSTVGGMSAIMADRSLYLAIFHPQDMTGLDSDGTKQIDNFGNKVGYTAAYFSPISAFNDGEYIEAAINPNTIQTATDAEKEAIKSLIQRGVYI